MQGSGSHWIEEKRNNTTDPEIVDSTCWVSIATQVPRPNSLTLQNLTQVGLCVAGQAESTIAGWKGSRDWCHYRTAKVDEWVDISSNPTLLMRAVAHRTIYSTSLSTAFAQPAGRPLSHARTLLTDWCMSWWRAKEKSPRPQRRW